MSLSHKYARIEDERRFLLRSLPADLNDPDPKRIVDLYWPETRMRLRRIETLDGEVLQRKLTQKYPDSQRPLQEYALFAPLEGAVLQKTRHRYLHRGSGYSIDFFEGVLEGLILAELEAGQGVLPAGSAPDFAFCEVTEEPAFTGGKLVQVTLDELTALLDEWLRIPG